MHLCRLFGMRCVPVQIPDTGPFVNVRLSLSAPMNFDLSNGVNVFHAPRYHTEARGIDEPRSLSLVLPSCLGHELTYFTMRHAFEIFMKID